MRVAVKLMGVTLAALLALALAPQFTVAETFEECVDACIDQWEADKADCDQQLAQRLAELDAEAEECLTSNPDPVSAGLCVREVNIKRANANSDYRRCISVANTVAYNCYRDCQVSPGQ